MKKIERLKSSSDSNNEKETVGQKFAQLRDKLNEIFDHINDYEDNVEKDRDDDFIDPAGGSGLYSHI